MTDKQRLVVIGNGMAGARLVEEVLARGGGDRFDITMFGDEPYGNYNRILLSNVLAGTHDAEATSSSTRSTWYAENGVTLHAGVRGRRAIDRERQDRLRRRRRRRALRHAGHRHRQRGRSCRRWTAHGATPALKHGVFVFRTLDDCARHRRVRAGRADAPSVIGGGLLGLEAARGPADPRPRSARRRT